MTREEHLKKLYEMVDAGATESEIKSEFVKMYNEHLKPKSFPLIIPADQIYRLQTPPEA